MAELFMLHFLEDENSEVLSLMDSTTSRSTALVLLTQLQKKYRCDRNRQQDFLVLVNRYTLDEFKTFFRMSRVTVHIIVDNIVTTCQENNVPDILPNEDLKGGRKPIQLDKKVLILLWYMSCLDKYRSIAYRFGVSESTACEIIHKFLNFISKYWINKFIKWPNQDEKQEMRELYLEQKNFPGVIGMIGGTHIQIRKPKHRGFDYYNRKDYYSVVLQGVVTFDLMFTNIYTGWPGKVHDARVFRSSPLFEIGSEICGEDHMLGDSAYPNLGWLLVPFKDNGHLTNNQVKFNKVHSSISNCVERAFGLLKGRFTRLQYLYQRDVKTIVDTIITGCILHNICLYNHDELDEIMEEIPDVPPQPVIDLNEQTIQAGLQKRLAIARGLP